MPDVDSITRPIAVAKLLHVRPKPAWLNHVRALDAVRERIGEPSKAFGN